MKSESIVDFWMTAGPSRWFTRDAAFDGALDVRFGAALKEARLGAFYHWAETQEGPWGSSFCSIRFLTISTGEARLPSLPMPAR